MARRIFDEQRWHPAKADHQPLVAGREIPDAVVREILRQSEAATTFTRQPIPSLFGLVPDRSDGEPVLAIAAVVAQHERSLVQVADHDVGRRPRCPGPTRLAAPAPAGRFEHCAGKHSYETPTHCAAAAAAAGISSWGAFSMVSITCPALRTCPSSRRCRSRTAGAPARERRWRPPGLTCGRSRKLPSSFWRNSR